MTEEWCSTFRGFLLDIFRALSSEVRFRASWFSQEVYPNREPSNIDVFLDTEVRALSSCGCLYLLMSVR